MEFSILNEKKLNRVSQGCKITKIKINQNIIGVGFLVRLKVKINVSKFERTCDHLISISGLVESEKNIFRFK